MTKLAPTVLSTSRETSNWVRLLPKAKKKVGNAIVTSRPEKTTRGPYLSMSAPTRMRAGMVTATLTMASTLMCSSVSHPTSRNMVVASGAMLNQM